MGNIVLRTLHPLDIVVTKIARLNERDKEDILTCIQKCELTKKEIWERGQVVLGFYPGNEIAYLNKLKEVTKNYF